MNYGYVKVAAAVPRVKVADCKFNASEDRKSTRLNSSHNVISRMPSSA